MKYSEDRKVWFSLYIYFCTCVVSMALVVEFLLFNLQSAVFEESLHALGHLHVSTDWGGQSRQDVVSPASRCTVTFSQCFHSSVLMEPALQLSFFPKSTASHGKPEALWDIKHLTHDNICSRYQWAFVVDEIMLPLKLLSCLISLIGCVDWIFPWVVKCSAACLLVLLNSFSLQLIFLFFFFSFSLFTGICFYTHSLNREFLKLYFPHCQRGLLLKKPTVPPQSLTLVFSNTNRPQPTCSYSSIPPSSHQVRAWIGYGMRL